MNTSTPESPLQPSSIAPKTAFAHQAWVVCKTHTWTRPETAHFLRTQAHHLERQGHPEAAAAKRREADQLDPPLGDQG